MYTDQPRDHYYDHSHSQQYSHQDYTSRSPSQMAYHSQHASATFVPGGMDDYYMPNSPVSVVAPAPQRYDALSPACPVESSPNTKIQTHARDERSDPRRNRKHAAFRYSTTRGCRFPSGPLPWSPYPPDRWRVRGCTGSCKSHSLELKRSGYAVGLGSRCSAICHDMSRERRATTTDTTSTAATTTSRAPSHVRCDQHRHLSRRPASPQSRVHARHVERVWSLWLSSRQA
jgi:hypothetical protein